jgi:hypothetical protein
VADRQHPPATVLGEAERGVVVVQRVPRLAQEVGGDLRGVHADLHHAVADVGLAVGGDEALGEGLAPLRDDVVRRDGRMYDWRVVIDGEASRSFVFVHRPACRDRAAAKASAPTVERELAGKWERLPTTTLLQCDGLGFPVPAHEFRKAAYGERYGNRSEDYVFNRVACESCAEAAGAFASPVTDDRGGVERFPQVVIVERASAPLPQWLVNERALMQSAPPTMVLPEFPRSKIERDNAMFRQRFQRSPRYTKGAR